MVPKQGPSGHENRRDFYEKQHAPKYHHPVHEERCFIKREDGDNMMSIGLVSQRRRVSCIEEQIKQILTKVANSVEQRPYMNVPWRVVALIIIENSVVIATHEEHA